LDKAAGQKFQKALKDAGVSDSVKAQMTQALRMVRVAQQKAQREFAFLRNATIAHRDPDAIMQYRSIVEIDELAVLRLVAEFYKAAKLFNSVLPVAIVEAGSMPGMFKQISSKTIGELIGS
jgi:hypothetical protein